MSSSWLKDMRPENVYTVCWRLLEMPTSKRLHKAFKRLKWNCFMDNSESVLKIEKHPSSKRLYLNFKS